MQREKCRDHLRSEAEIFLLTSQNNQVMNMHDLLDLFLFVPAGT